jgi:hypothetical protein
MPNTYIKIASSTVGSGGAANIDFTSIPATYTDLLLLISVRGTTASVSLSLQMTINGGGVTYTDRFLYGTGSAAASSGNGGTTGYLEEIPGASATASTFCNTSVYITRVCPQRLRKKTILQQQIWGLWGLIGQRHL